MVSTFSLNKRTNIKHGSIESGQELIDYLQPFPMKGTGWHRCVYVLFEHKNQLNLKLNTSSNKFLQRDFNCCEFYLDNQNDIIPVSISFFQTKWDPSVKKVFYNYLGKQLSITFNFYHILIE